MWIWLIHSVQAANIRNLGENCLISCSMRTKLLTLTYGVQIESWASDIQYLGLLFGSELLCTKNLRTLTNKVTDVLCNSFPLLARDSTLSQKTNKTKSALYKLLIQSIFTCAVPVYSSTSDSNYLNSKSSTTWAYEWLVTVPRVLSPHDYTTLNIEPIQNFIHRLTAKCFATCPSHLTNRKLQLRLP